MYLYAHDGLGGVHVVQEPGLKRGTLRTPPWTVILEPPPGFRRLPRDGREVASEGLRLTWEDAKPAVGGATKGAAGRLGEGG